MEELDVRVKVNLTTYQARELAGMIAAGIEETCLDVTDKITTAILRTIEKQLEERRPCVLIIAYKINSP